MSAEGRIADLKRDYRGEELRPEKGRFGAHAERKKAVGKLQTMLAAYRERQPDEELWNRMMEVLWDTLCLYENYPFHTAKKLQYSYTVKGYEIFVSRKDKSITRASVELALKEALELQRRGERVSGPKKLKIFGASYIYPVFIKIGVVSDRASDHISNHI